jgi:hypothetical protein
MSERVGDYHYEPRVAAEVRRLQAERDRLHGVVQRRNRRGTRKAFRRWEQAIARWEHALDAWRSVALQARFMVDPPREKRGQRPLGTDAQTISGGWFGSARDWEAIQRQRRIAAAWAADRAAGRTHTSMPEDP